MKSLFLCRILTACLLIPVMTSAVYAQDDSAQIQALFQRYIDAWNQADLATIGSEVYRPPIQIFEAERTQTLSSPEDIVALLTQLRSDLDAAGFSHSELLDVSICDLGGGLAFASFHYSRFDKAGEKMDESALSSAYVARHTEDGWRLVAHVMQAQPGTLSCSK